MLVGIKDTNDELVALTLRALADLVPMLGSSTVIGGKRAKLFTDGRPVVHSIKNHKRRNTQPSTEPSPLHLSSSTPESSNVSLAETHLLVLPERPQPDGEEVDTSTDEVEQSAEDDLETWEDWDASENAAGNNSEQMFSTSESIDTVSPSSTELDVLQSSAVSSCKYETSRRKSLLDITELDIKNQSNANKCRDDVDFFEDMEPVIEAIPRFTVVDSKSNEIETVSLNVVADAEGTTEDGWGEEDWD